MLQSPRAPRLRGSTLLIASLLLPATALAQHGPGTIPYVDNDSPTTISGGSSLATGIAIHMRDFAGVARWAEPVTFAVPFHKEDGITDLGVLEVLGPDGKPVPMQARATVRWGGHPKDASKPIRWALFDLQVNVPANGDVVYLVRLAPQGVGSTAASGSGFKAGGLKVKKSKKGAVIRVDTGAAEFKLDGKSFLAELRADFDGDGKTRHSEYLISGQQPSGFYLLDRFGAMYSANEHPVEYTIEESGPLRLVIRAEGRHDPVDPNQGIGRDFFQYTTRYFFYIGKPYMRVVHTLRNDYLLDPLGSIGFEGYHLQIAFDPAALEAPLRVRYGVQPNGNVESFAPARLYQDSDGGTSWQESPGVTFKGYRVYQNDNVVQAGDQAPGWAYYGDGKRGISLSMRWFFEQFPKGFDFDGQTLKFNIFPEEFGSFHWLDDGQQITTDFMVCAHGPLGPNVNHVTRNFQNPLRPFVDPEWVRSTRAWGDQGDLDRPEKTTEQLTQDGKDELNSIYVEAFDHSSYAFGWSEFGELTWAKNTHTTGSPRNKLTYFDRFAINGSYWEFRYRELWAIHSRDIRTYHIDGFTKEQFPNCVLWEGMPHWLGTDMLNRDKLDPALDPHRAGIPETGHGWNGFDFEHMSVDDLYEYYLLTGDPVSYDSLKSIGEALRTWKTFQSLKEPGSTRGIGWTMRALMKIWHVTGDPKLLNCAKALVAAVNATYGQTSSPVNGIVYHYITRYPPAGDHIPNADFECPWQIAAATYGLLLHHRETGDPMSLKIALQASDYIVDYGWNGTTMPDAVAVDDHTIVNPKSDNAGVNTWIPSALIQAYRYFPRPEYLQVANAMFDSLSASFKDPTTYLGTGAYNLWHPILSFQEGD